MGLSTRRACFFGFSASSDLSFRLLFLAFLSSGQKKTCVFNEIKNYKALKIIETDVTYFYTTKLGRQERKSCPWRTKCPEQAFVKKCQQ
jgi:hypothetical protein